MDLVNLLERYDFMAGDLEGEEPREPYIPGPIAIKTGILANPRGMARKPTTPPGVDLANNILPNGEIAGLVNTGNDVIAFDLVAIQSLSSEQMRVTSISKSRVSKEGHILGEGYVAAQSLTKGWMKIVAVAVDPQINPNIPERITRGRINPKRLSRDGVTTFNAPALEVANHRMSNFSLRGNSYDATKFRRFF